MDYSVSDIFYLYKMSEAQTTINESKMGFENSSSTIPYPNILNLLKPFSSKNISKANVHFILTISGLWLSIFGSYYFASIIPGLLFLTIPATAVFMCRSFVLLHDCGHGSYYRRPFFNHLIGNIAGFGILIPYSLWKYIHESHHQNVGNLDKRYLNPEIWTMTLKEYQESKFAVRIAYRFMRSKFMRFTITPTINLGLMFRLVLSRFSRNANLSVIVHDILYVILVWKCLSFMSIGFLLLIFYFPLVLFYFIASYTFYAQHQFEDTYWENESDWNYLDASYHGATCLEVPAWYRFLTGNVVYHNLHHLMSGIPFYNLHKAHLALKDQLNYNIITLSEVQRLLNYKVWDEEQKKLVPFPARNKYRKNFGKTSL